MKFGNDWINSKSIQRMYIVDDGLVPSRVYTLHLSLVGGDLVTERFPSYELAAARRLGIIEMLEGPWRDKWSEEDAAK